MFILIYIFIALAVISTLLTVLLTSLASAGLSLLWIVPLLLLGYYLAWHIVYATFMYLGTQLFVDLNKPQSKPSKFCRWHLDQIAKVACYYMGARIHVTGEELIPKDERFLIVCNHRSFFDPAVMVASLDKHGIIYISKPSNFRIFVGGRLMHKSGCLALERENNRQALGVIKRAVEIIDQDVGSICIYPEGTRSRTDELNPFHAGSFKIAQKAGVPVVLAAVRNTELVMRNAGRRTTQVYLDIIGTIDAEYAKTHTTRETADLASQRIDEYLKKVRKETEVGGC